MSLILYCIVKCILVTERQRLNMELELQSLLLGLLCTAVFIG
jgi:hypothetical protein